MVRSYNDRASRKRYSELESLCGDLRTYYMTNDEAVWLVKYLVNEANSQRKRKGLRPMSVPKVVFRGWRDSGWSSGWSDTISLSNRPSVYLVIHEVAHTIHLGEYIDWIIPTKGKNDVNENGRVDAHGDQYLKHLQRLRDLMRNRKALAKFTSRDGKDQRHKRQLMLVETKSDLNTMFGHKRSSMSGAIDDIMFSGWNSAQALLYKLQARFPEKVQDDLLRKINTHTKHLRRIHGCYHLRRTVEVGEKIVVEYRMATVNDKDAPFIEVPEQVLKKVASRPHKQTNNDKENYDG
jgi:hypothetical protein